jgi:hypothetical protein
MVQIGLLHLQLLTNSFFQSLIIVELATFQMLFCGPVSTFMQHFYELMLSYAILLVGNEFQLRKRFANKT